ncbi:MAG TPA: TetR/AcrR family transcriptional regulator [Hyphomicrobiaceae bacterium]|jgi:TetR/AcrR family transcriptional regulator, transcriptional repressor for nem operon|nr:TetR/AcrR family transcriptional regulator [Hyphomicrobiaceae bacterium]
MADLPSRRASDTRERILELAEASVLDKGFAATSIEELIAGAGITKSGFFYHFRDKRELARALMLRYIAHNDAVLADIFMRADELNEDPLHGFLVALKLFAEMMADLPATHPGCLVASFCYQDRLFDREVHELTQTGVRGWRKLFLERLEKIAERYPPKVDLSLEDLADMANTLVDGGIIMSRVLVDKTILPRQILLYREFIRTVFLGVTAGRAPRGRGAAGTQS